MKKLHFVLMSLILTFFLVSGCGPASTPKPELPPAQTQEQGTPTDETPDQSIQEPEEATEKRESEEKEPPSSPTPSGQLAVHFIDVGQGDAILIQTPQQNILIDAGDRGNTIVNYLKTQGVTSLDLVIGTHPHADHIGGIINVLQSFPVKEVIDPGVVHTSKTFEDYLTLIDEKNINFTEGRTGITRDLGSGAKMEILHPSSPSSSHLNDASIVAKVTFGQVSFMLTGDAEQASEGQILLQSQVQPTSTILKVGHHGSRTSTTTAFLKAVNPKVAVIMVGKGNTYGHPHEETLQKLADAGVDIYRTDIHGTIVITTDGQTYDINVKQPYQYVPQKVPEPEPKDEPGAVQGQYVGSKSSDKYHYPNCSYVNQIKPENITWFSSIEQAISAGYVGCKGCNPPGTVIEKPVTAPSQQSATVYITKTGAKYHRSGCRYLSKSMIPISLSNAKSSGYTPCSVCGPPR